MFFENVDIEIFWGGRESLPEKLPVSLSVRQPHASRCI
jgi:hypothetical protein